MKTPEVRVVLPREGLSSNGAKVFIDGKEFGDLTDVRFSGGFGVDDIRTSKLELTFYGDIIVERGNG
jgi:hypothetical protein